MPAALGCVLSLGGWCCSAQPALSCTGPKTVLAYLRAQLRRAEKCKLMKMIVIGPPRQGKSTLVEILQTGKVPQMMHSDATIRTTKWELPKPVGHKAKVKRGWRSAGGMGEPCRVRLGWNCPLAKNSFHFLTSDVVLDPLQFCFISTWP